MRWPVLVFVLAACARDLPEPTLVARCTSCDELANPPLGMANYKRVGDCRYEVRKGTACCLVRWDTERPRTPPQRPKIDKADGGFKGSMHLVISEQTFDPETKSLCPGERFEVCGEMVECTP